MNFSNWLYFLENATVSQTLKAGSLVDKKAAPLILKDIKSGLLARFGNQDWVKSPKFFDNYSKWLTYNYINRILAQTNDWQQLKVKERRSVARPNLNLGASQMEIEKDLTNLINGPQVSTNPNKFAQFRTDAVRDFLAANWTDQNLISQFNNTSFTLEHLDERNKEWHEILATRAGDKGADDYTSLIKLDKLGARWKGWQWVKLDRRSCEKEGNAMGHCGNAGGHEDDKIVSLRDEQNFVHLTFILRNGILGEMKGKGNNKPSKAYHQPIMELLKSKYVNVIKGGGYLPENNFELSDLSEEQQETLLKKKPYLNKPFEFHTQSGNLNQIFAYLTDLFDGTSLKTMEKDQKTNQIYLIIETFDDLNELYDAIKHGEQGEGKLEDFSFIDNIQEDAWSQDWAHPYEGWYNDGFSYAANRETDDLVEKILELRFERGAYEGIEEEEWEDMSFTEKLDIDQDYAEAEDQFGESGLKLIIDRAYEAAAIGGAYTQAWQSLTSSLEDGSTYFEVDLNPAEETHTLKINMDNLTSLYYKFIKDNEEHYSDRLYELYDFSWSAPYNGFDEFDDDGFNEELQSEVKPLYEEELKLAKEAESNQKT